VPYAERLGRVDELNRRVGDALARLPAPDALAALERAGAPVAPVLRPEDVERREGFPARFAHDPSGSRGPVPSVDQHRDDPWG
jgi:crotonobetainyl-CoA:carnitine CoA-transferase CaiB-like acyl-CoA transferase